MFTRVYTVHLGPASAVLRPRAVVLVKEGFCWPAFFFNIVWALFKGLWITAIILFLAQILVQTGAQALGLSQEAQSIVTIGFFILVGLFANDLRRFELERRGYREVGVIAASHLSAAEQRAFERIPALAGA